MKMSSKKDALVILLSLIVQGSKFACYFWKSFLCTSLLRSKGQNCRKMSMLVSLCLSDRQILKNNGLNFYKLVLNLSLVQNLGTWTSQTNTTKRRCLVQTAIGLHQVKICIKLMSKSDHQIWTQIEQTNMFVVCLFNLGFRLTNIHALGLGQNLSRWISQTNTTKQRCFPKLTYA